MSIQGLVELVRQSKDYHTLQQILSRRESALVSGLSGAQKSLLVGMVAQPDRTTLVITHTLAQAERLAQDLDTLIPHRRVCVFENNELMPFEEAATALDLRLKRLTALVAARIPGSVIVAPIQALSEGLVAPELFYDTQFNLHMESRIDTQEMASILVSLGYERVDMVEGYGQFSVRGGILDVFPFTMENPVRVELFDDEIDSIRTFDIDSQRSVENMEQVTITPARETVYRFDEFPAIKDKIYSAAKKQAGKLHSLGLKQEADHLLGQVAGHLELFEQLRYFPGMDQYKPFLGEVHSLIDYLPPGTNIIVDEPTRIKDDSKSVLLEAAESCSLLLNKGKLLPETKGLYFDWHDLFRSSAKFSALYLSVLAKRIQGMEHLPLVALTFRSPEHYHGNIENLTKKIRQWRRDMYRILLIVSSKERGERLSEFFRSEEIPAQYVDRVGNELQIGTCVITTGNLETGLEYPAFKLVVLTDLEIYGKQRPKHRTTKIEDNLRLTQQELKVRDYVVHVNHGIGQYLGVDTLNVGGINKDYLNIKYAGQDRLYVPTDQIHLLQRYVGLEDQSPRLSKLGRNEWSRVKKRVKESVHEMAEGLIQLYAEREAIEGFAYPEDTPWQLDFENSFPYQETPDQLHAITEVKRDMERGRPMDRLLCGDVGYGKTEVAIRAAFKAVSNGKQVAVLVPTTILAQQHHRTFTERFEEYPMSVGVLSRFQSPNESNRILKGINAGSVDIVIGTHRLLSKDIEFKDLGLVIVDEEQRFGVAQKERLKEISKNVDVLTLTATPIPRTLHMSLVGVRDMSVIETPPEDRYPIRTYVVEYDEQVIRQAIVRELDRKGQVYFVYNRVQTIDKMYRELHNLVPEARIVIAHGQMDETMLERAMLDFYNGEYDVLLCTTIIETGMDISNVNTLIIYDSDYLGLAQLYQLRGRVGRTNRVAYAYFTHRRDKVLSEDAEKRLQAIKEFTELGSGIKIAMRDLEIRGAGNILGPEQHGFIASVGFEMYCRLLEESIRELKGEVVQSPPDPVFDLRVNAYVDDSYVPDPKQKIALYKKIMEVTSNTDADDLHEEIIDRYGEPPEAVHNLLLIARMKIVAKFIGVASIFAEKDIFVMRLLEGLSIDREIFARVVRKHRGKVAYKHGKIPQIKVRRPSGGDGEAVEYLLSVLQDIQKDLRDSTGRNE